MAPFGVANILVLITPALSGRNLAYPVCSQCSESMAICLNGPPRLSEGYAHEPLVIDGDPERTEAHLPMIHIAFSNLKTWLLGTHPGVSYRHLQAYLNEIVFRFNRRFYPMTAFNSILGLAAHTSVLPTRHSTAASGLTR
jgi:hypothetical protein